MGGFVKVSVLEVLSFFKEQNPLISLAFYDTSNTYQLLQIRDQL